MRKRNVLHLLINAGLVVVAYTESDPPTLWKPWGIMLQIIPISIERQLERIDSMFLP